MVLNIEFNRQKIKKLIISGKSENAVLDWVEILQSENDYFEEIKKCSNLLIN
jgi:hypothetical protein